MCYFQDIYFLGVLIPLAGTPVAFLGVSVSRFTLFAAAFVLLKHAKHK
jgi:hypothetical protein